MKDTINKLQHRPESVLAVIGLILLAAVLTMSAMWRQSPAAAPVIYVSDSDKAALQQENSAGARININTATTDQLQSLSGIGKAFAQRIVDYRTENGEFKSVDELLNVEGIGEAKLKSIKKYITV